MPKPQKKSDVIQTSITMERQLKDRYTRLACQLDLSFSQLVRYALRQIEFGLEDYESELKKSSGLKKILKCREPK